MADGGSGHALTAKYCLNCGAPLAEGVRFGRTRKLCRYCGFVYFREPKVAVAALLSQDGCVLLVRRAAPPRLGFWALPAGYMDADELPEEALAREVAEETGLEVRVLGLHAVAPLAGWAERRGVLLVYRAALADPALACVNDRLEAHDDVSEVRWFTAAEIPWDDLAFESTAQFLREWSTPPDG
jgi:ADP-ribose pyrophosphatase YjhB (NUDIX family)